MGASFERGLARRLSRGLIGIFRTRGEDWKTNTMLMHYNKPMRAVLLVVRDQSALYCRAETVMSWFISLQ